MTKDQAIEVLVAHAKRCPEPEPREHGYPEDVQDEYREWKERCATINEAVVVLTSKPVERKVLARFCPATGGELL